MRALCALVLALVGLSAKFADAGVILPSGIQQNVNVSDVLNAGWTILYQGDYGAIENPISNVFGGAQDYLMLGAINRNNPGVITVLAGALTTDVLQVTAFNTTHLANGVNWYYNNRSMGFTPVATISQSSADTTDAPGFGGNLALGAQKLSWHTFGPGPAGSAPTRLDAGWRAGNTTGLNGFPSGWDRIVFTGRANVNVPEPASLAVFAGLAASAFGLRRRLFA